MMLKFLKLKSIRRINFCKMFLLIQAKILIIKLLNLTDNKLLTRNNLNSGGKGSLGFGARGQGMQIIFCSGGSRYLNPYIPLSHLVLKNSASFCGLLIVEFCAFLIIYKNIAFVHLHIKNKCFLAIVLNEIKNVAKNHMMVL